MEIKIVTSVAPYIANNASQAIELAHEDGFAGIELNEDHLHCLVRRKPNCLRLIKDYSIDKHMSNSIHKTLHRPSIDSENKNERRHAVEYTFKTIDYLESAGISRLVLHSFSDLPSFFRLRSEHANRIGYYVGGNAVKIYGFLAPLLKSYRQMRQESLKENFMSSLFEISKYAADKKVSGKSIEIVFEEHFSDAIDYNAIPYGRGNLINVVRGIDTAHHLIRTGKNSELSEISELIHFHAVDTNGLLDDHRTLGKGKVNFKDALSNIIEKNLTNIAVLEDGTRKSALKSKEVLKILIKNAEKKLYSSSNEI
jgi:sugar phosphate isomerase/epimerase